MAAAAAGAGSGYRVVGNGTRAAAVKHEPQTAFGTPPQRRIYDATALLGGASEQLHQPQRQQCSVCDNDIIHNIMTQIR